jgi:hypothetical protein
MGNNFSNPQRRFNNPDDAIGYDIQLNDACILNNSTGAQIINDQLIPNNGEYEFSKATGDCNYCSTCSPRRADKGSGCDNDGHCGVVGGNIPYYHRKAYLAPADTCCTNSGGRTVGDKTCDPKYRAGVSALACNDIYASKCVGQTNDDIFDDTCQTWCASNTARCNTAITNFCSQGNNLDRADCRAHALELGGADMDIAANRWCQSHMDDPFCACLKAVSIAPTIPNDMQKALSKPSCYVEECTSGKGYQNVNMRAIRNSCPPVNICNNTMTIAASTNVSLDDIHQSCDQTIDTSTSNKQSTTGSGQPIYQQLLGGGSTDKIAIYFIVFITVIILLVSGIYLLTDDDDDTSGDQTSKSPYIEEPTKSSAPSVPAMPSNVLKSAPLESEDSWF